MKFLGRVWIVILMIFSSAVVTYAQPAATWNYLTRTGSLGSTYSWIDCSAGTNIVSGDDVQASFNWPFNFRYYDNSYSTANTMSICTNGFIRLDGAASTNYSDASNYNLAGTATSLGQIIATSVFDCSVSAAAGGWVKFLVTGSAPNRILTIEYNNIEIDYNDGKYADVQVSFYESENKIVLKLGADNINVNGVDMGLHSGVSGYFNKWQEVRSGANNAWIEYTLPALPPAASWNYVAQTGSLGSLYNWIDCSSGTTAVSGDDAQTLVKWPFNFNFYDNSYNTSHSLSVCSNGFIRLDGIATTDYNAASIYDLTTSGTGLGQIIAASVYDGNVGRLSGSWCRWLVTGTSPYRIFTIEYNNLEIDYNDDLYADIQVSFYETLNEVVLKYGDDNISAWGVDMGIHSGVNGYFHKWQEAQSGTNNTWVRYTRAVEVVATLGSSIAYYSTLKEAFDKINDGTHRGAIAINFNGSTVETTTAALNASGTGSAVYTSVNIKPTYSGLSITGNLTAPLIDLRGADNVIIDGRVNGAGSTADLIISNTSISSIAGTSTLRFINDASSNIVRYCKLQGSQTDAAGGIVFFSTTTGITGNDQNTLSNNLITCAANANRPKNAIYSLGTAGKENSANVIDNNLIYDFLKHGTESSGISLEAHTTAWTISGNSFYETTTFAPVAAVEYNAIKVNNPSGNGFIISNNYIGGSQASCAGAAWTKTNSNNNVFHAITIRVGTATASSVQNNVIKNFNWNNSANASWTGIEVLAGNVNIGSVAGNTVGVLTGTGSITITGGTTGGLVYGFDLSGSGILVCQNNAFGSITSANTGSANASNITAINITNTGKCTVLHNSVGSQSEPNSIAAISAATGFAQLVTGIANTASGWVVIEHNVIANLTNATTNTNVATPGQTVGISSSAGIAHLTHNTVFNLANANANQALNQQASVIGMSITGTAGPALILNNTVRNLTNSFNTFSGGVIGIYFGSTYIANAHSVNANFIHSLNVSGSSSTGASLYGIKVASGNTVYSNNIVTLTSSALVTLYGIFETGTTGNNNKIYFNTLYIGGSLNAGSTQKSYSLYSAVTANTRDLRNNLLVNERSTTSGTALHYALYIVTAGGSLTVDYNNYYVSGAGGMLGYYGANKAILPIVTGQDAGSLALDPQFTAAGGTLSADYYSTIDLPGVLGTGIVDDFNGLTRYSIPKIGALENNRFVWKGSVSNDFGTPGNWVDGVVPGDGADISFDNAPLNHCLLDVSRSLRNITNAQSTYRLVMNGKQLTITGNLDLLNGANIDATGVSSGVVFKGHSIQTIPVGCFVSNTVNALEINNAQGLVLNENMTLTSSLTLTSGPFFLGSNTLAINGLITSVAGTLTGGPTTNITLGGGGVATTLPLVTLNNLTVNRANGIALGGNVHIGGTLTLTAGILSVGGNTLTMSGNAPVKTGGALDASNANAHIVFSNSIAMTLPASVFVGALNNLTLSGSGGVTAGSSFTVNGILNLQNANPSAFMGLLHMSSYTLDLGSIAEVTGTGDITGIVRRTSFVPNVTYTFSHRFSGVTFPNVGVLPVSMSLKTTLGTAPAWKPGAIKRIYEVIQTGGSGTQAVLRTHYLDSELNGNDENKMVDWSYRFVNSQMIEHGRSNYSTTDNWVDLSNADVAFFSSSFGAIEISMSESELTSLTWNGSVSSSWVTADNWTPTGAPSDQTIVIIPDAATTPYDPFLPAFSTCGSITLENNAILNSQPDAELTINGAGGAWNNQGGTFYSQTSTVIFTNPEATLNGTTSFYNLSVLSGASLTLTTGSYTGIGGVLSNAGSLDAAFFENTVEYKGAEQTVINPNGSNPGYLNLILSGSGVKTMPVSPLLIGTLTTAGTVSVIAGEALTIRGNMNLGQGTQFNTGNFDHHIGGNFENNGTFNSVTGWSFHFNGVALQNILGANHTVFAKLEIDNPAGVSLYQNITITDELLLMAGNLTIGASTLTLDGSLTQIAGALQVNEYSSLDIGGTTAMTLEATLFTSTPVFNNFTVRRTGGITLACNLTVMGNLNLEGANASATKGIVDLWDGNAMTTLILGENATTTGEGDVTGIVKRTVILPNITYTFGNRYSSISFPEIGTLPTEMSVKIRIGTAPSWKPGAVQRIYDVIQTGGGGTLAVINVNYLDSELNGNAESKIVDWSYRYAGAVLTEHGRSNYNTVENWVTLSNVNVAFFSSTFGNVEISLDESELTMLVWNGSQSTSWVTAQNWTPNGAPSDSTVIFIPDAATTANDPILPALGAAGKITLEAGAILNAAPGSQLTLNGSSGVWSNQGGVFNASTSTVIFTNPDASINGTTHFYNLTVNSGAAIHLITGCYTGIAGVLTNNGILRAAFSVNTIEYNGTDQQVINPNGLNVGYHHLILSGSGNKTLPDSTLHIQGNFTLEDTVTAIADADIKFSGHVLLGAGSTFITGIFNHSLQGNLENNGDFTASASGIFTFRSTQGTQYISGSSVTNFANLTIENLSGVNLLANVEVNNTLTLAGGMLNVGASTLGINGNINQLSDNIMVTSASSLSFGGSAAITIQGSLFTNVPAIYNLTINNSSGVTFATDMTVNGQLYLQSSNPSATVGSLDMFDGSAIKTLYMGPSAVTTGTGDVTGIVTIGTIVADSTYSMGSRFTSVTFPDVGTLPAWVSMKIKIGTTPSWKPGAIKRTYDFIQSGGSGTQAVIKAYYLDSELNGNDEAGLVDFSYRFVPGILTEHGRSGYDTIDNWVALSNVNIAFFSSSFGVLELSLSPSELSSLTWNGSVSTSWITADNWTPLGAPSDNISLIIPDATLTLYDPTLPVFSSCKSITIQSGGVLNAEATAQLTLNGSAGAWVNEGGTLNAANSVVIFTNQNASLAGTTNFYHLTIAGGATLTPAAGSVTGIAGTLSNEGTFNAGQTANTIDYNGGNQVIVNPNGSTTGYYNLTLNGSGEKSIVGKNLVIRGALTLNDADFITAGSTVVFAGSTQSIGGTGQITFDNLMISLGSVTNTITSGHKVLGILTCNGTLYADGNLTLSSTVEQTALIAGSGTGQILGDVIMQRYLNESFGYKYFSSPFMAATVNEFAGEVDLLSTFSSFYRYEENRDTAWWFDYSMTDAVLQPMHGYAVNFGVSADSLTVNIKGVVSSGAMSVDLSNNNRTMTQGFNLVGNPYPSPIDWDAEIGWTRSNVDNAVYYFNSGSTNQYVGSYSTYINGVSSDGIANNIIPAMQGFFVHVSNGDFPVSGNLGFSNDIRVNTLNPVFHKNGYAGSEKAMVRIAAGYAGMNVRKDPAVILMGSGVEDVGFDTRSDAIKMMNTDPEMVNLYALNDGLKFAIKTWSLNENSSDSLTIIPLGISVETQGIIEFSLQGSELQQQYPGYNLYFHDNKHRAIIDLDETSNYTVFLEKGVMDNRFSLILSRDEIQTNAGSENELSAYYLNGKVYVYLNLPAGDMANLQICDMTGRILYRDTVTGVGFNPLHFQPGTGIYIITLSSVNSVASKKLLIPKI